MPFEHILNMYYVCSYYWFHPHICAQIKDQAVGGRVAGSDGWHTSTVLYKHCTLHSLQLTLYSTSQCTEHTSHNVIFKLHTSNFTLCTVHFTLHTSHCTLHMAHCILHTAHCTTHPTLHSAKEMSRWPCWQRPRRCLASLVTLYTCI